MKRIKVNSEDGGVETESSGKCGGTEIEEGSHNGSINKDSHTGVTEAESLLGSVGVGGMACRRKFSFVAIHLGAGNHSTKKKDKYKRICDKACGKAIKILKSGGPAEDAITEAIKILEDSGEVNAGAGSNLTLDGSVECDAGFMDGDGHFGGVGAIPGVPNPILVAKLIADVHRNKKLLSCGRVPPNFMVGDAARTWAISQGIPTCDKNALISKRAKKTYDRYAARLQLSNDEITEEVNDTVGAIALDCNGRVSVGVSSGGNWMKYPGRIGHSPVFGSGCYCSNKSSQCGSSAIAVSSSGSGEMLSRVRLPQECAYEANDESSAGLLVSLVACVKTRFLENRELDIHKEPRYIGLIGLTWDGSRGEFAWVHSSQNFVIGYQSSKMRSTKMTFSELEKGSTPGVSLNAEAMPL